MNAIEKRLEWLRNRKSDWHEYKPGHYHVSTLSQECLRKSWAQTLQKWKPNEYVLRAMDYGTHTHRMMEEMYPHSLLIDTSVPHPLGGEIHIVGHTDVDTPSGLVDIKTCKTLPDVPKREHVRQLNYYLHALSRSYGFLAYYEKNAEHPLAIERIFRIEYDGEKARWIEERAKTLHAYIIKDKEPPRCRYTYCDVCAESN